jgi:hypothetical protein
LEPRQQILTGLVLGLVLIALGIRRGWKRGRLSFREKLDYGYILKLILLGLTVAGATVNTILTFLFVVAWGMHVDQPGDAPASIESFLPHGYPIHVAMGLVVAGALCIFSLAVIGLLDHINTDGGTTPRDESSAPG